VPFGNKFILEVLFSSVLSIFKNYHPSGNLKFINLGIFQSLKLRNLMGKILEIFLKQNFAPNNLLIMSSLCITNVDHRLSIAQDIVYGPKQSFCFRGFFN